MEMRHYLVLLRRWIWVLAAGVLLGAAIGYGFGRSRPTVFESSTRLFVARAPDETLIGLGGLSDNSLTQTYTELLKAESVIQTASKNLGYPISPNQVRVEQVRDTQLIQISVESDTPQSAKELADEIAAVFIAQNETLQTTRYANLEDSLQAQLSQVQTQMDSIQEQIKESSSAGLQDQLAEVVGQIDSITAEIEQIQGDIVALQDRAEFAPNAAGFTAIRPTPKPTASTEERTDLAVMQGRLGQLNELLGLYQSVLVTLSVPEAAATGSGATARADQLQSTLALYRQIYASLLGNYEDVRLARLRSTPGVTQVEGANLPLSPIRPSAVSYAGIGGVLGLMLAAGVAFAKEYLDNTFESPEEIEDALGLSTLGSIGDFASLGGKAESNPIELINRYSVAVGDSLRFVRTNLEFVSVDKPIECLLVTSPGPEEGKSTVSILLAIVLAQQGKHVLMLDADLRRPSIHAILGLARKPGLSDLLSQKKTVADTVCREVYLNMDVLTAGTPPPNPIELLGSDRMRTVLTSTKKEYDTIIVDSPPVYFADTSILASLAGNTLLVLETKRTRIDIARKAVKQLSRADAHILGVVVNRVPSGQSGFYSGAFYYGSEYFSGHQAARSEAPEVQGVES